MPAERSAGNSSEPARTTTASRCRYLYRSSGGAGQEAIDRSTNPGIGFPVTNCG